MANLISIPQPNVYRLKIERYGDRQPSATNFTRGNSVYGQFCIQRFNSNGTMNIYGTRAFRARLNITRRQLSDRELQLRRSSRLRGCIIGSSFHLEHAGSRRTYQSEATRPTRDGIIFLGGGLKRPLPAANGTGKG